MPMPHAPLKPNALHQAIASNSNFRLRDVKEALSKGADPNGLDHRLWSPAMCAAIFDASVLETLLDAGADPSYFIQHHGLTLSPLSLALKNDRLEAIALLVNRGASLDHYHGHDGLSGALFAAAAGRLDLLETRLALGDSPLSRAGARYTPLSIAATRQDPACVEKLLILGASPLPQEPKQNSAFIEAIRAQSEPSLRALLKGFPASGLESPSEISPLGMAVSYGWEAGVKALIEHGVSLKEGGRLIDGPATVAIHRDRAGCLSLLLAAGLDPREPEPNQPRLINLAASLLMQKCMEALLTAGEDLLPNPQGDPLKIAQQTLATSTQPTQDEETFRWMSQVSHSQKEARELGATMAPQRSKAPGARL